MLTKTVTKKSVALTQPKLYAISFTLMIADDAGPGFTKDFVAEYHTGDNVADKVAKVTEEMQAAINIYKAEQAIFKAVAMDNAVTAIDGGLML